MRYAVLKLETSKIRTRVSNFNNQFRSNSVLHSTCIERTKMVKSGRKSLSRLATGNRSLPLVVVTPPSEFDPTSTPLGLVRFSATPELGPLSGAMSENSVVRQPTYDAAYTAGRQFPLPASSSSSTAAGVVTFSRMTSESEPSLSSLAGHVVDVGDEGPSAAGRRAAPSSTTLAGSRSSTSLARMFPIEEWHRRR